MNQKEVARRMDMAPVQVRRVVQSARSKRVPITARKGMAVCYDKELVRKEAETLAKHAAAEIETAKALMLWVLEGESDEKLTPIEEQLISLLPVIEAPKETVWDSSEEFPFIEVG